eukprot:Awhi_evm1s14307
MSELSATVLHHHRQFSSDISDRHEDFSQPNIRSYPEQTPVVSPKETFVVSKAAYPSLPPPVNHGLSPETACRYHEQISKAYSHLPPPLNHDLSPQSASKYTEQISKAYSQLQPLTQGPSTQTSSGSQYVEERQLQSHKDIPQQSPSLPRRKSSQYQYQGQLEGIFVRQEEKKSEPAAVVHECSWMNPERCGKLFTDGEKLLEHIRVCHLVQSNVCWWENCKRGWIQHVSGKNLFKKKDNALSHIRIHLNYFPHKCDVCKKSFKRHSDYKKHSKQHRSHILSSASVPLNVSMPNPSSYPRPPANFSSSQQQSSISSSQQHQMKRQMSPRLTLDSDNNYSGFTHSSKNPYELYKKEVDYQHLPRRIEHRLNETLNETNNHYTPPSNDNGAISFSHEKMLYPTAPNSRSGDNDRKEEHHFYSRDTKSETDLKYEPYRPSIETGFAKCSDAVQEERLGYPPTANKCLDLIASYPRPPPAKVYSTSLDKGSSRSRHHYSSYHPYKQTSTEMLNQRSSVDVSNFSHQRQSIDSECQAPVSYSYDKITENVSSYYPQQEIYAASTEGSSSVQYVYHE